MPLPIALQHEALLGTCPFCGQQAALLYHAPLQTQYYAVLCEQCRAWGPTRHTEAEARQAWNRRTGVVAAGVS